MRLYSISLTASLSLNPYDSSAGLFTSGTPVLSELTIDGKLLTIDGKLIELVKGWTITYIKNESLSEEWKVWTYLTLDVLPIHRVMNGSEEMEPQGER